MQNLKIYFGINDGNALVNYVKLLQWLEVSKCAKEDGDKVYVLPFVHDLKIEGESIYSVIKGKTSEEKYFLRFLGQSSCDIDDTKELIMLLDDSSYINQVGAFGDMPEIEKKYPEQYIEKAEDLQKVKIYYLKKKKDFSGFEFEIQSCFKKLHFNKFNWSTFDKKDIPEILDDLQILQDEAMDIYESKGRQAGETLKELNTFFECSGASSAKYTDSVNLGDKTVQINYAPHIKIERLIRIKEFILLGETKIQAIE